MAGKREPLPRRTSTPDVVSDAALLRILRALRIVPLCILAAALLVYALDFLLFQYRLHTHAAYSTVAVTSYIAVPEKGQKTAFYPPTESLVTCAISLFPHNSSNPCWWVRRHTDDRQNI